MRETLEQKPIPNDHLSERRPFTLTWRMEDPKEVSLAKERFMEYVKAGWLAFVVTPENRRVQVFEFDPRLERVVLIPFAEGG
jgi:hypothetical protein